MFQKAIIRKNKLLIDKCEIEQISSTKFLRFYVDQYLTWSNHIKAIAGEITPEYRNNEENSALKV